MQIDRVRTIPHRAQEECLILEVALNQLQCLVRVAGKDHLIKYVGRPGLGRHRNAVAERMHSRDCRFKLHAATQNLGSLAHIVLAAARNRAPFRALLVHQTVVVEELEEADRRIIEDFVLGRRPDRRAHRQDIIVPEGLIEPVPVKPRAERRIHHAAIRQLCARNVVELEDRRPEAVEARAEQIALLRKDASRRGRPRPSFRIRHGKAHVRRFGLHIQRVEQSDQVRIVETVVYDEA